MGTVSNVVVRFVLAVALSAIVIAAPLSIAVAQNAPLEAKFGDDRVAIREVLSRLDGAGAAVCSGESDYYILPLLTRIDDAVTDWSRRYPFDFRLARAVVSLQFYYKYLGDIDGVKHMMLIANYLRRQNGEFDSFRNSAERELATNPRC